MDLHEHERMIFFRRKNLKIFSFCWIMLVIFLTIISISIKIEAKEIEASGTVEEATNKNFGEKNTAYIIEKNWGRIKEKAQNFWRDYFSGTDKKDSSESKKATREVAAEKKRQGTDQISQENAVTTLPATATAVPETSATTALQNTNNETTTTNPTVADSSAMPPDALPQYRTTHKGFSSEEIQNAKNKIKEKESLTISAGRQGTSQLPLASSGVPTYNFYEIKKEKGKGKKSAAVKEIKIKKKEIPLLDIGEEPVLSAQSLSDLSLHVSLPNYSLAKPLKQPEFYDRKEAALWMNKKIMMLGPFDDKSLRQGLLEGYPVTREVVDKIIFEETPDQEVSEKKVKHLNSDEQAMLMALILNRKGDKCALVIGLFDDLAKKKPFVEEASFQLGICAQKLKIYSQAFTRLMKVIEVEEPSMAPQAIAMLAADLPSEYEVTFTKVLESLKNKSLINEASSEDVHYVLGKGNFKLKKYESATQHAQAVGEKNKKYINARYLLGVAQYSANQGQAAMKTLLGLRSWMEKKAKSDKNVSSLMAINIARIYFTLGDYKNSLEEYKKIGKDHPVWLQGLIEQGWAQVSLGDNSGAIGNMHSLHSPYFKSVYKPESYVVRSIGYLNICQYGDAYKALHRMEQEHMPWIKAMDDYLAKKHSPSEYYETVKNYLRSPSTENVDGLPFQVIREMGRSRNFLNFQTSINDKVDEGDRYPEIPNVLAKGIKEVQAKMNRAKTRHDLTAANLAKAKTDTSLARNMNEWTAQKKNDANLIIGYKFQLSMLDLSQKKLAILQKKALSQLSEEKNSLRMAGGQAIGARLSEMRGEVKKYLENNELLRYEIFAGAGENIRYQVAGGETATANRIPSNVKPTKILNWEFDGEYWEDEIGNYRSRAQDNCPQKGKIGTGMGGGGVQGLNK